MPVAAPICALPPEPVHFARHPRRPAPRPCRRTGATPAARALPHCEPKYGDNPLPTMLPRRALKAAVEFVLSGPGRTVPQVEADEARGRTRKGDAAQEAYRGKPVWHTKREIDREVVRILRLDPSLCGPDRKSNELQTAVAATIASLRRSGRLVDWNVGRRFNTYRLAGAAAPKAPAQEGAHPDLAMTSGKRLDSASVAAGLGASMWGDLVAILRHGPRDNTYKFALARALIELCAEQGGRGPGGGEDGKAIPYRLLAEKFLRYYWHQEYRFRMKQNFHASRPPRVIRALRDVWGEGAHPGDFESLNSGDRDRAVRLIMRGVFGHARRKTSLVVPRFQNFKSGAAVVERRTFYDYDDDAQEIVLQPGTLEFFRENRVMAEGLVTLEWAKYLERVNGGLPSLVAKVERADARGRNSALLLRYRRAWSRRTCHCFYCRGLLERGAVHVDHFIPWSYIFDDSEWNLVLACRACNMRKGSSLPQHEFCGALVRRNRAYEPAAAGLRQSLRLLDRGSGWEREIENHYDTCLEYGFGTVSMP